MAFLTHAVLFILLYACPQLYSPHQKSSEDSLPSTHTTLHLATFTFLHVISPTSLAIKSGSLLLILKCLVYTECTHFPSAKIIINLSAIGGLLQCGRHYKAIHIHSQVVPYNFLKITVVIPLHSVGI